MSCFAGLDISTAFTTVCIVDADGEVVSEATVDSTPERVMAFLDDAGVAIERIGLEACPFSEWIFESLAESGYPVVCLETRHLQGLLKSGIVVKRALLTSGTAAESMVYRAARRRTRAPGNSSVHLMSPLQNASDGIPNIKNALLPDALQDSRFALVSALQKSSGRRYSTPW